MVDVLVRHDKQLGTYDDGVVDLGGHARVSSQGNATQVHTDVGTGAKTMSHLLQVDSGLSFEQARLQFWQSDTSSGAPGFYRSRGWKDKVTGEHRWLLAIKVTHSLRHTHTHAQPRCLLAVKMTHCGLHPSHAHVRTNEWLSG